MDLAKPQVRPATDPPEVSEEADVLRRDDASLYVLEAIILTFILLGAAYSVTKLQASSVDHGRPRGHLETVARDAMTVLSGLEDANGSLLEAYLLEAYHCAVDAEPSDSSCEGRRGANLSFRLESYLPPGTGYAVSLDNGVEARDLYRSMLPPGETVSATYAFTPTWNLTFLLPEMSCYEPGMEVNLSALPIRRGSLATLDRIGLVGAQGDGVSDGERAHAAGFWNLTLPASERSSAPHLVTVDATGRGGTFAGVALVSTCGLGGLGEALVETMRMDPLVLDPPVASLGQRVTFRADASRLGEIPGVSLLAANVTVYEPVPPRPLEPGTHGVAKVLDLGAEAKGELAWDVPPDAFYGVHPVVLRVGLDVAGTRVEARSVSMVTVALPDGTVPIDPPYRAVLQVWFSDWR